MASTEAGAAPYPVVITLPSFVVPASTSVIVTQREKESLWEIERGDERRVRSSGCARSSDEADDSLAGDVVEPA